MDKLSVKGLALGIGVPWGLCMLAGGWMAPYWASGFVQVFSTVYPGYAPGLVGGMIGGIEAFFDGAAAGAIIALIYNWVTVPKKHR
ncbi:MAG: membrane-associated protein [Candidatus Micrarchaeota archaeon]|nr:membrane-associated protein [Candidatus Micrarchaeota archaeon]